MPTPHATIEEDDMPDELGQAEPSLEALMEKMLGGAGWQDLNAENLGQLLGKQIEQQRQAMKREAQVFRECFSTPAGRKVLNIILDQTLRAVAWPVHAVKDGDMLQGIGVWREGQNALVATIIEAIAMAKNKDVQPRSTT